MFTLYMPTEYVPAIMDYWYKNLILPETFEVLKDGNGYTLITCKYSFKTFSREELSSIYKPVNNLFYKTLVPLEYNYSDRNKRIQYYTEDLISHVVLELPEGFLIDWKQQLILYKTRQLLNITG